MGYIAEVLTLAAILAVATHGYMLIKGLGGMLHLGHAVFYGIGAYAAAILATRYLPAGSFPLSVLGAGLTAALGGVAIGWPALRERGRYFMIVTFAFQLIFITFIINLSITGGPDGLTSVPGISLGAWQPAPGSTVTIGALRLSYVTVKLAVMTAFAALSFAVCRYLILSPYGRLVRAVRDDEVVAEAYGHSSMGAKLSIFVIGAAITGMAGGLFAHHFNYVGPTQFELDTTILFIVMLIAGGQYSLSGATVGALVIVVFLEILRYLLEDVLHVPSELTADLRQFCFAVALILLFAFRNQGIFPERLPRHRSAKQSSATESSENDEFPAPIMVAPKAARSDGRDTVVAGSSKEHLEDDPILSCRELSKRFGGIQAVANASLDLHSGKIVVIIGPNGAGKTSLFNILSGVTASDAGEVTLKGRSIQGLGAARIAQLGLARTFQNVRPWGTLTAIENVLAARRKQPGANPIRLFAQPLRSRAAERDSVEWAFEVLERFGLQHYANVAASELSYAQRKMLSLARISAFDPEVMLLDEPTSGVDPRRLDVFLSHIRAFSAEGKAICLVEHNMTVVRDLAHWVVFMDEGRTLAAGTPSDILQDRTLMRVYLGHRELKSA